MQMFLQASIPFNHYVIKVLIALFSIKIPINVIMIDSFDESNRIYFVF